MHYCFLEAFERVHAAKRDIYERMSFETDKVVKQTEPHHVIHVQDIVSTSEEEVVYRWVEIFDSAEGLQAHFDNPAVAEHVGKLASLELLVAPVKVVIYCDWPEEKKQAFRQIEGLDLSFASLVNGFYR